MVVLAALCWGISGGIGGILMDGGWDDFVVSFYRGAIGLVFVPIWLVLRPQGNGLASGRLWFWSVIAGLGVAGNFAFYFVSIAEGSVAVAATLMYCAPAFVYIISFAFRLERPTIMKWVAIAVVMFGIMLLTGIYKAGGNIITPFGVVAGLLSGLSTGHSHDSIRGTRHYSHLAGRCRPCGYSPEHFELATIRNPGGAWSGIVIHFLYHWSETH